MNAHVSVGSSPNVLTSLPLSSDRAVAETLRRHARLLERLFPGQFTSAWVVARTEAEAVLLEKSGYARVDVALAMQNPVLEAAWPLTGSVTLIDDACPNRSTVRVFIPPGGTVLRRILSEM